jgi:hypothetical protein
MAVPPRTTINQHKKKPTRPLRSLASCGGGPLVNEEITAMVFSSFAIATPPSSYCDRAAVLATALTQIFSSSMSRTELQYHIEEMLRSEFADVAREAAADRSFADE